MDDLISEFVTETSENLSILDQELVKFEQAPKDKAILNNIFRMMHTIKGTCGFLGLPRLEKVAHAGEDVLDKFRDGKLEPTAQSVTLVLKCIDHIRGIIDVLADTGAEGAGDDSTLIAQLRAVADGTAAPALAAPPPPPPAAVKPAPKEPVKAPAPPAPAAKAAAPAKASPAKGKAAAKSNGKTKGKAAAKSSSKSKGKPAGKAKSKGKNARAAEVEYEVEESLEVAAEIQIEEAQAPAATPALSPEGFPVAAELMAEFEQVMKDRQPAAEAQAPPEAPPEVPPEAPQPEAAKLPAPSADSAKSESGKPASQTIRVNVDLLENLMTLVSEMVLTRNQLLQLTRASDDSIFKEPIQRLSRTTSELQEGVMKTRMQPIGNAWAKLPRIVRDLANELGKKINLEMHGEDTELDRQVLELIQDPLTHMVRNSADHGIERPADRAAAGKPEVGTIRLSAFHEGGHIIIEIVDDGRGINTERIRAKIIERGLGTAEEVAAMDNNQVNQFIMKAGFSTAEKVTKVSGRGVGMDVVRSNIEKIGGNVEFRSTFGQGSTFTIKIPLTLAIISSLIVSCNEERFALPQIGVVEVVRISERSANRIESLKGAPVLRLREHLLPLVNLNELLKLDSNGRGWAPGLNTFEGYVVVCRNGSQVMGVIVDAIADSEEIVVKPLSPILGGPKFFSGNTILGDGRVVLILDLNGLSLSLSQETVQAQKAEKPSEQLSQGGESILLFRTLSEGMKAVPLSQVQRIESFDMAGTEVIQGEVVVQYRDHLLPLLSLDGVDGVRRDGRQTVLVFGEDAGAVGLAIETVVDIAHDQLEVRKPSRTGGVIGSGIVGKHAVDIVDPEYFLGQVSHIPRDNIGAAA